MPAETHSHLGPLGGDDVERVVRDQLVEILGVDPDASPSTRGCAKTSTPTTSR